MTERASGRCWVGANDGEGEGQVLMNDGKDKGWVLGVIEGLEGKGAGSEM